MSGTLCEDRRVWRVGEHYGIHIYAVDPDSPGHDVPIATAMTAAAADQIVADHNAAIENRWHEDGLGP